MYAQIFSSARKKLKKTTAPCKNATRRVPFPICFVLDDAGGMGDETPFLHFAFAHCCCGCDCKDQSGRGSRTEAAAGVLRRLGEARWPRIGKNHGGRRGRNMDGTMRQQPRYGMMTMVAEKRGGTWPVVVAQNTNAVLGIPPELQDIHTPSPFRGPAKSHNWLSKAVAYGNRPRTRVASATRPTARIMAPARGGTWCLRMVSTISWNARIIILCSR